MSRLIVETITCDVCFLSKTPKENNSLKYYDRIENVNTGTRSHAGTQNAEHQSLDMCGECASAYVKLIERFVKSGGDLTNEQ